MFWNTRDGPFFGFPFMAAGLYLAQERVTPSMRLALVVFVCGGILEFAESAFLHSEHWSAVKDQFIGTLPFGIGAFLIALRAPDLHVTRWAAKMGRYSMGLYTTHLMILEATARALPIRSFQTELLDIAIALTTTAIVCIVGSRIPYARSLFR